MLIISPCSQIWWTIKIKVIPCKIQLDNNWIFLTLVYMFFIVAIKNGKLKKIEFIGSKPSKLWKLNFRSNLIEDRLDGFNRGNNKMKQINVLVKVWFTTSKVGLDFYYNEVASRVSGWLKTEDLRKLGNIKPNLKNGCRQSLAPSLPSRNKILAIAAKNHAKQDLKGLSPCPIRRKDNLLLTLNIFHTLL